MRFAPISLSCSIDDRTATKPLKTEGFDKICSSTSFKIKMFFSYDDSPGTASFPISVRETNPFEYKQPASLRESGITSISVAYCDLKAVPAVSASTFPSLKMVDTSFSLQLETQAQFHTCQPPRDLAICRDLVHNFVQGL